MFHFDEPGLVARRWGREKPLLGTINGPPHACPALPCLSAVLPARPAVDPGGFDCAPGAGGCHAGSRPACCAPSRVGDSEDSSKAGGCHDHFWQRKVAAEAGGVDVRQRCPASGTALQTHQALMSGCAACACCLLSTGGCPRTGVTPACRRSCCRCAAAAALLLIPCNGDCRPANLQLHAMGGGYGPPSPPGLLPTPLTPSLASLPRTSRTDAMAFGCLTCCRMVGRLRLRLAAGLACSWSSSTRRASGRPAASWAWCKAHVMPCRASLGLLE